MLRSFCWTDERLPRLPLVNGNAVLLLVLVMIWRAEGLVLFRTSPASQISELMVPLASRLKACSSPLQRVVLNRAWNTWLPLVRVAVLKLTAAIEPTWLRMSWAASSKALPSSLEFDAVRNSPLPLAAVSCIRGSLMT